MTGRTTNSGLVVAMVMIGVGVAAARSDARSERLPLVLDIEQACRLVLQHNPDLRTAREQLKVQDGVLRQAGASGRPHLTASGSYRGFDKERLQSFGGMQVEETSWNASLDASLTVFSGWRNRQFIKGEKARKRAITSDVTAMEQELLVMAREAYCDALLAQIRIEVQQEVISVVGEQLTVARNRLSAGVGEQFDVTQAEVALAGARPPMIRAENDFLRGVDRLRGIIGLPYADGVDAGNIELQKLPDSEAIQPGLHDSLARAARERPEVQGMEHQIEVARRELKIAQWDKTPEVDLFAGYGVESDQFGGGDDLAGWAVGARASWPLIDGGARRGKVQQARARLRASEYQKAALLLGVEGEVRRAYYDWQEANTILQTSHQVIEQAAEAVRLARNRYDAGKGTQLNVLESQLQLTRSRLEHSTAIRDLTLATSRMKRAIGEPLGPTQE